MRIRTIRGGAAAVGAALAVVAMLPLPAGGSPKDATVVGVYLASECAQATCDPQRDRPLPSGAVVSGEVQIFVSARADLGLEWVRLEGIVEGDDAPNCIEFWNAERRLQFEGMRRWNTTTWTDPSDQCTPQTCSSCTEASPHQHGAIALNLPHALRVVAHEQGGCSDDEEQCPLNRRDDVSQAFTITLQNRASSPRWVTDPASSESATGASVGLQWAPNPEPDVVEYRFVRTAPDGARTAYAISATTPEDQGCRRIGAAAYRCSDVIAPGAPSGAYRYAVAAVRRAPSGPRCEVAPGRCVVGVLSQARTVSVTVPPKPASRGSASATASPTPSPVATTGRPVSVVPPTEEPVAAGPAGPASSRSLALPLAGMALAGAAVAGALAFRRLRRDR